METYNAPELAIKAQHKALTETGNKLKERTAYTNTQTCMQNILIA